MNRGRGLTAGAGAVVVGAALLHGGFSTSGPSRSEPAHRVVDTDSAKRKTPAAREGPWLASCNYWRPTYTETRPPASPSQSPETTASQSTEDTAEAADCGPDRWGIPVGSASRGRPEITSIIATLPDPVHSSLSLDFDRLVDVITQAAADNGFLVSYYWLPWSRSAAQASSTEGGAVDAATLSDVPGREKQPGLLLLRSADAQKNPRLIYLFLVAQTPALGLNGDQIRNALDEERFLHARYGVGLSLRDPVHGVDLIGPNHSGSAESLRRALLTLPPDFFGGRKTFHVAGTTATYAASQTLTAPLGKEPSPIDYVSFGEDTELEWRAIRSLFGGGRHADPGRLALLVESGTAYASAVPKLRYYSGLPGEPSPLIISFPREISLLRNAQQEAKPAADGIAGSDPYLHLSLKTGGTEDTIAHFSPSLTPFSQEAQWMSIVRELRDRHVEAVSIVASNILDELFLAKYLHRDLPDARVVVFEASDLLFARTGDNGPYIGMIAASGYPLVDLTGSNHPGNLHSFASTWTEQFYNAVSYMLWDGSGVDTLSLSSYGQPLPTEDGTALRVRPPPLWMTVVGRDGYYPLTILDPCGSNNAHVLPVIVSAGGEPGTETAGHVSPAKAEVCNPAAQDPAESLRRVFPAGRSIYPGFTWYALCVVVTLLCLVHALLLRTASFWSPSTRDLAIDASDEPRRRSVYLHISAAMLLSLGVVTAAPLFFAAPLISPGAGTVVLAICTTAAGVFAAVLTLRKTFPYLRRTPAEDRRPGPCGKSLTAADGVFSENRDRHGAGLSDEEKQILSGERLYSLFHRIALLAAVLIPLTWCLLCSNVGSLAAERFYLGPFFAYRSLYPTSGVSPALPVLLILLSWYIWSILQTKRLRFSANSRPMLPHLPPPGTPLGLYVPEEALSSCSNTVHSCLFENITCLLITRQLVRRVLHRPGSTINLLLATVYLLLFLLFVLFFPVESLDHFLRRTLLHPTLYEFLVSALFYPLLIIALTGCVRMVMIWNSLRGGLLEPLERSPLRFAFSRLTNVAWMTMFKQNGVYEYWRDMTRSNQSLRQILHCTEIETAISTVDGAHWQGARNARANLETHINSLLAQINANAPGHRRQHDAAEAWDLHGDFLFGDDLPSGRHRAYLNLMCAIECDYVTFAEALLAGVLIPYWTTRCVALVESEPDAEDARDAGLAKGPRHVQLAEEFLALRYFSLIRAVLINLRQLMTFVSVSFVLSLLAWNSYPFEPRQWIGWTFTALLFGLGAAVIWLFAQMHRNPILSRITGTQANELGMEFWLRLATFGAVPVLTWLASQFPAIGSTVSRLLQQGTEFTK